jgi:signal transduction histidine kinase
MKEDLLTTEKLESLGVLAAGIAHDFNNLMQVILGNISLAKLLSDPEEKIYKLLEDAENSYARAVSLTNQLLTFSRGEVPLKKTISLERVLESAVYPTLHGSGIKSACNISHNLRKVEANEDQLIRVLQNIVQNARDAMPDGGLIKITVENAPLIETECLALNKGEHIKISIEDEGVGISENNLAHIFDPYFTTKKMDSENGKGLGLAICYSIIKKHDGLITVESETDMGTIFHIFLPVSD